MFIDPKRPQLSAEQFIATLDKEREYIRTKLTTALADVDAKAVVASELPPGFHFDSIIPTSTSAMVFTQVERLEDALELPKLFQLAPLFRLDNGWIKAEIKPQERERYAIVEVQPVFARVSGLLGQREDVQVRFYAQLQTQVVEVIILLLSEHRIRRSYQVDRRPGMTVVENTTCTDATDTFTKSQREGRGTEEHPHGFTLWNPLA